MPLLRAMSSVSGDDLVRLVSWAETVRFGGEAVFGNAFPKDYTQIRKYPPPAQTTLEQEFAIATRRLLVHRNDLREFVAARSRFENELLDGSYGNAIKVLEEIESSFGVSYWLLEAKIALLALSDGLEAQKNFVDSVKTSALNTVAAAVAYYVSERNEPSVSPGRYIERVKAVIEKSNLAEGQEAHLLFRLARVIHETDNDLKPIVAYEKSHSVIDLLDTIVDVAIEIAVNDIEKFEATFLPLLMPLVDCGEEFLVKIAFLHGLCDATKLRIRPLDTDCFILETRGELPNPESWQSTVDPRSIWNAGLSAAAKSSITLCSDNLREKTISSVKLAADSPSDAREHLISILKTALNFGCVPSLGPLRLLVFDFFSSDAPFDPKVQLRFTLSSPSLDPWDLLYLPAKYQQNYIDALKMHYGNHPVVQYVISIVNEDEGVQIDGLSAQAQLFARALTAAQREDQEALLSAADELQQCEGYELMGLRWRCRALLALGRINDLISLCAEYLVISDDWYRYLPIDEILEVEHWSELQAYSSNIGLSILLDADWKHGGGSEVNSYRRYAVEDFLSSINVDRPSAITELDHGIEARLLIHFLSEVSVSSVLDLMLAFDDSRSVQDERRKIWAALVELDESNGERYREEIAEITKNLRLEEGVRLLDQSRIFVDEEAFEIWAKREVEENYERFRSLDRHGIGFDQREFSDALRRFIETQEPMPAQFLSIPKGEADQLLLVIITTLKDAFLKNPTFGLDSYLSVRVRHGTISGMLRGPLEAHNLILQRVGVRGSYVDNGYWPEVFLDASADGLDQVANAIAEFSEAYDALIDDLRNRLQIRSDEQPTGLLFIDLNAVHIHLLRGLLRTDMSFDGFVSQCADVFWAVLDPRLEDVQAFIDTDLKNSIATLREQLEKKLQTATGGGRVPELIDAVGQAFTALQAVLDNLKSWFERGGSSSAAVFPMDGVVDIALEAVRSTYVNFIPEVEKHIGIDVSVATASIAVISDIIFTALDNVYSHAGNKRDPKVAIRITDFDGERMEIEIKNDLDPGVDLVEVRQRTKEAETKMQGNQYQTEVVATEGGTGLLKLKNRVDPSGQSPDAVKFGVDEDGRFWVAVKLGFYRLSQ